MQTYQYGNPEKEVMAVTLALDSLFQKILSHYKEQLPFVVYKKPESNNVLGLFQWNANLYTVKSFEETGYIFAPFDGEEVVLLPENESELVIAKWLSPEISQKSEVVNHQYDQAAADSHQNLVKKGIDGIEAGLFNKVVLSRKEAVAVVDFDIVQTYKQLADSYPTAFVYCWYHPQKGLWMGAFSEQLLKIKGNQLFTMAVAGTQKWPDNEVVNWQQKEKEEQLVVTDFIIDSLKPLTVSMQVSDSYTLKAGSLAHIKTDIKAELHQHINIRQVIDSIHPTPAVCGLPKQAAKEFILENENYNREYYSGYHGELNKDFSSDEKQTDLFVNLRCMKIVSSQSEITTVSLYVGGGITKDSVPEKEWEETVNKSRTIGKVLGLE